MTSIGGGGGGGGRGSWGRQGSSFTYEAVGLTRLGEKTLEKPNCKIMLKPSTTMREELRYVITIKRPTVSSSNSGSSIQKTFNSSDFTRKKPLVYSPQKQSITNDTASTSKFIRPIRPSESSERVEEKVIPVDPREEELEGKLYKSLLEVRNQLGDENGYMPYLVATNRIIKDLAKTRPTTLDGLRKTGGMPEVKVKKFGPAFVQHIRKHCIQNNLPTQDDDEGKKNETSPNKLGSSLSSFRFTSPKKVYTSQPTQSSGWIVASNPKIKEEAASENYETTSVKTEPSDSVETNHSHGRDEYHDNQIKEEKVSPTTKPKSSAGNTTKPDQNSESKYFVPSLNSIQKKETCGEDDDLFGDDDDDFFSSYNYESEPKESKNDAQEYKAEGSTVTVDRGSEEHEQKMRPVFRSQSVKRKGVVYSDSDTETDAPSTETDTQDSQDAADKYERIRAENKRKIESSGWINTQKMKKKMKKNSLFQK